MAAVMLFDGLALPIPIVFDLTRDCDAGVPHQYAEAIPLDEAFQQQRNQHTGRDDDVLDEEAFARSPGRSNGRRRRGGGVACMALASPDYAD
jgi:hypothetical protein